MSLDAPAGTHTPRTLRLHRDRFPGDPILDTAISHAMLRSVAAGRVAESLRLYVPEKALLFSSLDARSPGYSRAMALAEEAGFPAVIRLAGGQAAAFLDDAIAFAWAMPDPEAHLHIRRRFEDLSRFIVASLTRLGLDARVGPVPGEYCPGEFSVNLGGRIKIMGVGQRVIRGGAHVGGVLTVAQSELLRDVLGRIYEALGFEFRSETAGTISDVDASLGVDEIMASMAEVLRDQGYAPIRTRFDASLRAEARALMPMHDPAIDSRGGRALRSNPAQTKVLIQEEEANSRPDRSEVNDS